MVIEINNIILAAITTDPALVSGGVPVFKVANMQQGQEFALNLSAILNGMAHDVGNGVIIIVKH